MNENQLQAGNYISQATALLSEAQMLSSPNIIKVAKWLYQMDQDKLLNDRLISIQQTFEEINGELYKLSSK